MSIEKFSRLPACSRMAARYRHGAATIRERAGAEDALREKFIEMRRLC
jgi:hypothetical protein